MKDHTWTFCPYRLPYKECYGQQNAMGKFPIWFFTFESMQLTTSLMQLESVVIQKTLTQKQLNTTTEKYFIAE